MYRSLAHKRGFNGTNLHFCFLRGAQISSPQTLVKNPWFNWKNIFEFQNDSKETKLIQVFLLRWFVDNEIVPGNHGTEYRIRSIPRTIHNKIVKCEVNNVIGKSEETETLDIQCKFYQEPIL